MYFSKWSTLLGMIASSLADQVVHPELDLSDLGGSVGLLGSFTGISMYNFDNATSFIQAARGNRSRSRPSQNSLYSRDPSNNNINRLATFNGQVDSIYSLDENDNTMLITGNFTEINNSTGVAPIIFNYTSGEATQIFSNDSINGSVRSVLIDKELVYLGGDFKFNNTYGVAVYNITSKQVTTPPFQGFGENSSVNTIVKIFDNAEDNSVDNGSIVFGGEFNTLGLKDLLTHNSTSNNTIPRNMTNTSLITAEQVVSLKHGIFSSVNAASQGTESEMVCPSTAQDWSLGNDEGGQWLVELPDEMKGLTPTKVRLYTPTSGDDGVQLFRIYSYPNNGIMNLSYIDPETNELSYCDAWCPLVTSTQLKNFTSTNKENVDELANDSTFIDKSDGSYATYYDPTSKTKVLGYASNYQEFSFENEVSIDKVGFTILGWYGSKGVFSGFELFSNSITVYGNNTLNEPNCNNADEEENYSSTFGGDWKSVKQISAASISGTDYLVSTIDNESQKVGVTLYPNISYSGIYSIIMTTPGCIQDSSCDLRSIVNVTVYDVEDEILDSQLIYQNNDYDKFDYLFYGHMNGSATSDGQNKIEITYHSPINEGSNNSWIVVDKVIADIVSLDKYYGTNQTNTTSSKYGSNITQLSLNGLFEYSLSNFSSFDEKLVHSNVNNKSIIKSTNTYVGNSSINFLSSKLSSSANVSKLLVHDDSLLIAGDFGVNSTNLNDNLITLKLSQYNSTSNQTEISTSLKKRADGNNTAQLYGASFSNEFNDIVQFNDELVFIGDFNMTGSNLQINNLSNNNESISTASNFAVYNSQNNGQWYGLGNNYTNAQFNDFANITVNDVEFFVFAGDSQKLIWDNTNSKWVTNTIDYTLNISQSLSVAGDKQIVLGDGFSIMDLYSIDQARISGNNTLSSMNFSINGFFNSIESSYYVNDSISVVGGRFNTSTAQNVAILNNNDGSLQGLNGNLTILRNTTVQSLYAGSDTDYLFIGVNGSATAGGVSHTAGVIIYDLTKESFTSFQPAELATSDQSSIQVNSLALHDTDMKLLVGGAFSMAGSLECNGLCIYDISNTRWIQPTTNGSLEGTVNDMIFITTDSVLLAGNLGLGNENSSFVSYDFESSSFAVQDSLNTLNSTVTKFIKVDNNGNFGGRFLAYGPGHISGYDGSKWTRIDDGIDYSSMAVFTDFKLLTLKDKNSNNTQTYFDSSRILIVTGAFTLKNYGLVNAALYDGTTWIPYSYTNIRRSNRLGLVKSILVNDLYAFKSSEALKKLSKFMSKGKVVGISLACAIGSTAFLSLLYLIPYFALFRKSKNDVSDQRIQENEMMGAVNPEDLIHEIDLQKK
ncbi:bud site selection protein Rax2p [[Candida] anglica]